MATQTSYMKPVLTGVVGGALLTMVLGFTVGGWVTGSKAEVSAVEKSKSAVISALAPICLSNFKASSDATDQKVLLTKTEEWKIADFVKTGGWAKVPGSADVSTGLARTCAQLILAEK